MSKILIDEATVKLALEALMRSRKAVSGDLDLAGCAYGKNDPDGHRYDDAKKALETLDKAITALREALAEPDFWEGYVPEPDKRQQALDKKAQNARELGLDYEPAQPQRWAVFCQGCRKEWSVSYPHPGKDICVDCDDKLAQQDSTCSNALRAQGKAYPRTCKKCGLGPCVELAQQALDKMAENARELGLDYEPRAWFTVDELNAWADKKLKENPQWAEQPSQQEPVAWVRLEAWKSGAEWPDDCFTDAHADGLVPLYTTPPAAQLAPMQEPVGWVNHANIASAVVERERGGSGDTHTWSESKTAYHTVPFYTTPPAAAQQQWTGLTDEEIEKGRDQTFSINNPYCPCNSKTMRKAVRWAEAKLKEKNT